MAERFALSKVITGSTWENVWSYFWLRPARGYAEDSDGARSPVWTNREAVAIIAALREVAARASGGFPLWYQFAAAAYGWDPATDTLDSSRARSGAFYPQDAATQLASEMKRIAVELAADVRVPPLAPRLTLDEDMFDDRGFGSEVARALRQDGARAQFKIPLPACKDPKSGRPRMPARDRDGNWRCDPVMVDDPLTASAKGLLPIAVVLVALWAYGQTRGRRR